MTYRAPVADIAFALKHAAGSSERSATASMATSPQTSSKRCSREAGKFATDVLAPLDAVGDRDGHAVQGRCRHHAAGLEGGLSRLVRGRLERAGRTRANGAARPCRTRSTPPASKCGTRPPWLSVLARC